VEENIGCAYDMNEEDEVFLTDLNSKKSSNIPKCEELEFEEVMQFFETTAHAKQPFATVDNANPPTFEEMEASYDDEIPERIRYFAKDIYEHWKAERLRRGNRSLMPDLKVCNEDPNIPKDYDANYSQFETGHAEKDDADPYVCFRRREVRQIRKTRGRDAKSTEILKKLRKELEDARQLVAMVKEREEKKGELLRIDRMLFEQRDKFKKNEVKRKINAREDDELLINQKVCERRVFYALTKTDL
jgi:enhancer of polycomb-like protein